MSLQTLKNINTSHQHSKNYTIKQRIDHKLCLIIYNTLTNQQPTYFYNSLSFPSHSVSTRSSDSLYCFFQSICPILTWQKGFLCHRSGHGSGIRSLDPDTRNSFSLPIFRSKLETQSFQNCSPSLGSFPSPLTVYPDFDSCYSHVMPYRMTPQWPIVRHRAFEVHHHCYYIGARVG